MQHALSKTVGFLANRHLGFITQWAINKYINHFNVDLSDALLPGTKEYKTFNQFFARKLKEGARPIDMTENIICSPSDGKIVQVGKLNAAQWHIKGHHYPLDELLTSKELCDRYQNGYSINIYLSPRDYHRVHMPFDGVLKQTKYIKGKLYSVNPNHKHFKYINKNERLLCEFYNEEIGYFIVMFIGALNVGSINTVWQDCSNSGRDITVDAIKINKGMELGHFAMGSSILLITEKSFNPCKEASIDGNVKVGMPLLQFDIAHDEDS